MVTMSLTDTGTPFSRPPPSLSAALACSRASSAVTRKYALRSGLSFSIRSRYIRVSSTELTSRRFKAPACSSADANGSIANNLANPDRRERAAGQRLFESPAGSSRQAHQQATAGLCVAKQQLVDHVQ